MMDTDDDAAAWEDALTRARHYQARLVAEREDADLINRRFQRLLRDLAPRHHAPGLRGHLHRCCCALRAYGCAELAFAEQAARYVIAHIPL